MYFINEDLKGKAYLQFNIKLTRNIYFDLNDVKFKMGLFCIVSFFVV